MNEKEKIAISDYYALKRKLWVETLASCAARSSPYTAATMADEAVREFDKRFRPV